MVSHSVKWYPLTWWQRVVQSAPMTKAAGPVVRMTVRIPADIYKRLDAYSKAQHDAPLNGIIAAALARYLPKAKRGA